MRSRLLTAGLLVAFAAQAAGLGEALHLAVEDGRGGDQAARGEQAGSGGCRPPGHDRGRADPTSFRPAARPGHSPLHCPICQAQGILKATVPPLAADPVSTDLPAPALAVPQSPALAKAALPGLGPRAPPANRSTQPSA